MVLFTGLNSYKLTEIEVTEIELGRGSYATVLQLDYMGLKCAGKKIHELILQQGSNSYSLKRFEEECRILSQVRHPNIVQFLGVFFLNRENIPILVMEYLPTNLTSCIEKYGIFPEEISYSILHDIALGLSYLHSQNPPICHRDLSSNNILLTPSKTAKIADLGVARILSNVTPLKANKLTETPGTNAFMPPEVMEANPKYSTSVDIFSYGNIMIHIFSGTWPQPQGGQTREDSTGKLIAVTEAERREQYLQAIGNNHPLMGCILSCIESSPKKRPNTNTIVKEISDMVSKFPPSYTDLLETMTLIKDEDKLTESLKTVAEERDKIIRQQENDHSLEVKELKQQLDHLRKPLSTTKQVRN